VHDLQINIEIQDDISDTIITIKCREQDIFIERLIAALQIIDRQIMVRYNENIIALNLEEILYIE